MEVSVFELLAAAREIQGTDYVEGDGIMCEKRYEEGTHHMIEFSSADKESSPEKKNRYYRRFLSESGYRQALEREGQGKIRIVRHARLSGGALDYILPVGEFVSGTPSSFREIRHLPAGRKK